MEMQMWLMVTIYTDKIISGDLQHLRDLRFYPFNVACLVNSSR